MLVLIEVGGFTGSAGELGERGDWGDVGELGSESRILPLRLSKLEAHTSRYNTQSGFIRVH